MSRVARRVLTAAGGVCVAGAVLAQTPLYRDVTATHLPDALAGACMNAAAGDADGDGDLDLALAMEFEPKVLLLNEGSGVFADGSERLPRAVHDSEDVAFADFDSDGDLDLVLVSEDDRKDELYLNDGSGRFTDASDRLVPDDVSNALAVLDLNGDGAPDVLTGNIGTDRALINDGRGRFRDETAERWPQSGESRTQDLELADVDLDGDLDVLVGNEGQDQLFLNEGGRLVDATVRRLPARDDETRKIEAGDFDRDGDPDLVVGNVQFVMRESAQDYLLLNDGSGVFTAADSARLPEDARNNFMLQVVDLDRDGDLDVLAPSTVFARSAGDYLVLVNDGAGRFSAAAPGAILPRTAVGNGFDVEVADFDDDGVDDLFLCNRASLGDAPADSGGLARLLLGAGPRRE
jgi:VCBS repeat protein